MAITCPSCNTLNAEQAHFCKGCGESLFQKDATHCPKCGTENPEQARFCKSCGFLLKREERAPEVKVISSLKLDEEEEESTIKVVGGKKIAEIPVTGETMEELDKKGDILGLRRLAGTFSATLKQMRDNTNELTQINGRIDDAIELQKNIDDKKVDESKENCGVARKKIRALEELSALKNLQDEGSSLYRFISGSEPPATAAAAPEPGFEEPRIEEPETSFDELEDFGELEDLSSESEEDGFLDELVDDSGEELEELSEEDEEFSCPKCDQPVPADATKCPNCGVQFEA